MKENALLGKLASVRRHSTFFALVIVAGLSMRVLSLTVTSLTTARPIHSAVDFLSFCLLMLLGMAAYKKFHNQKVIW